MSPAARIAASIALCLAGLSTAAHGQTTAAPASSAPAAPEQLKVVIGEVSGLAQFRQSPQDKWQKAVAGTELSAGGEIRTGPRSKVICTIAPDQAITIDRLGTISVAEAVRTGNKTTTEMVMKYGRTDYVIEAAGKEHDATIRTPNSTLAVRGTAFTAYDQPPFEPSAQTYRGVVDFTYAKRLMAVSKGTVARARKGPAETALDSTVVDPAGSRARTAGENAFIANEVSRGATLGFDQFAQITTLSGGSGPQTDAQLLNALPGRLNFVIRWTNPGTDFNLAVLKLAGDPLSLLGSFSPQEVLYPGFGLDTTKTGGRILFDDRGGPHGGQEVGFYNTVQPGIYGLQALQAGGPGATVSFSAFLDGKAQTLFATKLDADGNPVPRPSGFGFVTEFSTTITRYVAPNDVEVATALIPFPPELLPATTASSVSKVTAMTDKSATAAIVQAPVVEAVKLNKSIAGPPVPGNRPAGRASVPVVISGPRR